MHMYKKFTVNENFFNKLNEDSCYVLGWLLTDGCIQYIPNKKYSIRFELAEIEPLETIKRLMGSNHKIVKRDDKANPLYTLVVNSKKIVKSLLDLGITTSKTKRLRLIKVEDKYMPHLIRGIFDGDGSVFITKHGKHNRLSSYICSTSKEFLQDIGQVLKDSIDLVPKIYEDSPGFYKLRYGAKESYALSKYMYEGADSYLKRKKDIFEEGIKSNIGTGIAKCAKCGEEIIRVSNRTKWCPDCKKAIKLEQWRQSGARKRQKR